MIRPSAGGARVWCLAFLGLGLPVCVALALTAPLGETGRIIVTDPTLLDALGTLGLRAGEGFGLEPAAAARLGRLADAAAYTGLGLAALALASRGQAALFALLCLPASLAASFSPDGLIIALAALAAALLTPRPLTGPDGPARRVGAALAIALIVLANPPCAPVAAMLLVPFPPPGRLGRFCRRRLSLAVLTLLPAALWTPLATARVVGAVDGLGGRDLVLPWPVYGLWAVALLVPFLALRRGPLPPPAERLWLTGGALLGLGLAVLSHALRARTDLGADRLDGLQGRDLLPLVPMLVLAFARGRIGTAASLRWPALLPVLAAAIDVAALPLVVLRA
ncbi:DUF2142 domain-containing protein [Methylobacterium sp. NEAU K]|uniref:DUF2142 domain-containing protein n=1 Tax=Methylobacterium sp. NEAU K TaxID=3064946 RepID=UPI002733127D|nr:DUF2142 domain-containing protein [Methylobacterium sp. NEAU K]MDP4005824.1 DUF2142 domain-containing protein [Methylobacterium sp. NEAU K]